VLSDLDIDRSSSIMSVKEAQNLMAGMLVGEDGEAGGDVFEGKCIVITGWTRDRKKTSLCHALRVGNSIPPPVEFSPLLPAPGICIEDMLHLIF